MADFTTNWDWPQWTMLILLFLGFVTISAQHGKPKIQKVGDEKGQPERYSGFAAIGRFALWMFILICGGFFA